LGLGTSAKSTRGAANHRGLNPVADAKIMVTARMNRTEAIIRNVFIERGF
jgi:hypothetical protein